jgi:hypothetical protein
VLPIACGNASIDDGAIVLPERSDAEVRTDAEAGPAPPTDAPPETAADVALDTGPCTICERFVFVTSTTYNGNLGGLSGADALCQVRAEASTSTSIRAKTFRAWLSTPTAAAVATHVHGTGLYRRSDGAIVATGFFDLVDGVLAQPIALDELGNAATGTVWTGTNLNGSSSASTCDGWTSASSGVIAQRGIAEGTSKVWTDDTTGPCDTSSRLYCVEQ